MFKKLLFAFFTLFTSLTYTSCELDPEEDDEYTNPEWNALCKENSWLYEFPEYTGDFSSSNIGKSGNSLIITINGVKDGEKEFAEYEKKLVKAGFSKESGDPSNITYFKTSLGSGIDYSVSTKDGVAYITFAKIKM